MGQLHGMYTLWLVKSEANMVKVSREHTGAWEMILPTFWMLPDLEAYRCF